MGLTYRLCVFVLSLLIIASGCSQGQDVITPATVNGSVQSNQELTAGESSRHLWGLWHVIADSTTGSVEITALRTAQAHFNITQMVLETGSLQIVLGQTNWWPNQVDGPNVAVDTWEVSLQHPLVYPRFTGFDVRGIIMFNGTKYYPGTGETISDRLNPGEIELINDDGHTALWDLPGTSASLNAYRKFAEGEWIENYRNAFYVTDDIMRPYWIVHTGGVIECEFAIDANWAEGTPPYTPDDFPRDANCSEPWLIRTQDFPLPTPGFTTWGGEKKLIVKVYDYDYDDYFGPLEDPEDIYMTIECPEIIDGFFGPLDFDYDCMGADAFGRYALYGADIPMDFIPPGGFYRALLKVHDLTPAGLDAYKEFFFYVDPIPDFTGFIATDGTQTNPNEVLLTWIDLDKWYMKYYIYRLDYNYQLQEKGYTYLGSTSNNWYIDSDARQTGFSTFTSGVPDVYEDFPSMIGYMVKPVIEWLGQPVLEGPGQFDFGFPRPVDIDIYFFCTLDNQIPIVDEFRMQMDLLEINAFWNRLGVNFVLSSMYPYWIVGEPSYLDIETSAEARAMHAAYGYDTQGLCVYYVNSYLGDLEEAAFVRPFIATSPNHTHLQTCILLTKDARGDEMNPYMNTLPHAAGQAIGRLFDLTNLDANPNDEFWQIDYSCAAVNNWSPDPFDPFYCHEFAAYPVLGGTPTMRHNLEWFPLGSLPVWYYDLHESQGFFYGEWLRDWGTNWLVQ